MHVQVRSKQVGSTSQVKDILLADELASRPRLLQDQIQFVEPATGHHVDVRDNLMTLGIAYQVDAQSF